MTRTRNSLNQAKPEWLGEFRICTKVNPYTQTYRTYEGFQFNNITARVGDFVLVSNVDADEQDTLEGCDVARIDHLFESTRHGDKYRANVQWYSKPSKIPETIDSEHMDFRYEIVEDCRKFDSNVSIETICKKCNVINAYEDEIPEEVYLKNKLDSTPVFVCRYRLCQKRSKFYIEPVIRLEGMCFTTDKGNSFSGNTDTEKNLSRYAPNSFVVKEGKEISKSTRASLKMQRTLVKINGSTPKSKSFGSENESQNKTDSRLTAALRKCSIDSDAEASKTASTVYGAINHDSDFENSPRSTPRKNPSRSSKKNETPLRSNRINTLGYDSNYSSAEKVQSRNISKNSTTKTQTHTDYLVKNTPTKAKTDSSSRKRRAARSSSEESLEPRSRSVSPEIDCIGPPAVYQLYTTNGQTFVIEKPISMEKKISKKLDDSNISDLVSSNDSDDEIFETLKKSGTKIVARSTSNDTGFELLNTPNKNVRLLENIREDGQVETPKSARRNLSQTLEVEESRDARKDLLLKKMIDKREDASLRIKLRRSSEQSIYKIDSDSDNNTNNKSRRRTVVGTPKSILKMNSKGPGTPSVQFSNQDEVNEYSPTTELSDKLLKVEIKLKRVDPEAVRKSSRNKKASSRYSDYYEIIDSPITKTESPNKRVRKTIDYNEHNDDSPVPDVKKITRQTRRSMNITTYRETTDSDAIEKFGSETDEDKMECSNNKTEADDSNGENHPNGTPRRTRYSGSNSVKDSNGISTDQLKTPTKVSQMNRRDSSRMTKNDLENVDLTKTPRSSKRTMNTNNLTTPSRRSAKLEYEEIEPSTPKRSILTPKKTPSKSVKNGLLTPSMKQRNMCVVQPSTPLQDARARLHVSAVPKSLPCREEEFNNIYTFLEGKLMDKSGGCLYISGVPGTGKTATVNEVIRCLKKSVSKKKLDNFEFLQINGMKLTEPRQAYVEILKQLTGKKATWEQAHQLLDKRFTRAEPRRIMTLLLVDELDILCNKRQDVVYNLLDWPAQSSAQLVVITIANTMDLPERVLMGRVTSRLGLTRLTFQPYTHKQLQEIVSTRLKDSHAFKSEAIQLVARKVAAVSGDARRALDICRRATEVAEVNNSEIVSMQDVNEALTEMIASAKVQAIKHCSEMERTFLQAVCAEVARTGVEEVTFNNIYIQLTSLCSLEGLKVPSVTEAITICAKLGASRLLICEHSRTDIHQRVLLNVSSDDVHFSMQDIEI